MPFMIPVVSWIPDFPIVALVDGSPAVTSEASSPFLSGGLAYFVVFAVVVAAWFGARHLFLARRRRWTRRATTAVRRRDADSIAALRDRSATPADLQDLGELLAGFEDRLREREEAWREAEFALEAQREAAHRCFSALPGAGFVLDEARRFREVSTPLCELCGRSEQELVGLSADEVLRETAHPGIPPMVQVISASGEGHERRLLVGEGQEDGSRVGLLVAPELFTEPESAGPDSEVKGDAMEAMAELAGSVARDFNDQLTAILGHSTMLLGLLDEQDPHRGSVEEISAATEQARLLTRQLLAFSRREIARPEIIDLNRFIEEKEGGLGLLLGDQVELDLQLEAECGQVRFDPVHLYLVLKHLVQNAREAMGDAGRVVVRTEPVENLPEHTQGAMQTDGMGGEWVKLSIADEGPGMSREGLARMFEPYFTTRRSEGRRGMGLPTVYGLVRQNRGRIAVANGAERDVKTSGLYVEIFLPMAEHSSPPVASDRTRSVESTERPVVCVVEDDPQVRRLVAAVLGREDVEVLLAENGRQALDLIAERDGKVDLVLTDVNMPVVGGLELAGELRRRFSNTETIFMSGFIEDEVFRVGVSTTSTSFLQKPFTPKELLDHVKRGLARTSAGTPGGSRVLLIDDEEGIRDTLQALVESLGHSCRIATNGDEALDVLRDEIADIVISDMVMPGKDGIQTCIAIRRLFPDTKIIAMSGKAGGGSSLAAAERLGAIATLTKPFSRDELRFALDRAVE